MTNTINGAFTNLNEYRLPVPLESDLSTINCLPYPSISPGLFFDCLYRNGTKLSSPLTHDCFYDDDSSSSDDQYLYGRSDFNSDSSDSEVDLSNNRSARLVFINGQKITPRVNVNHVKEPQRSIGDTNSLGKSEPRPTRRIRFAQDGEDTIQPLFMAKKDTGNDIKSRATMTVTIRSEESKTLHHIKASRIDSSRDKVSYDGRGEACGVSNPQKAVARIRIQSRKGKTIEKSRLTQVPTDTVVDEGEVGRLKRTDSGILPSSSSSVSQDTADSFDKDDGRTVEADNGCDKEAVTATLFRSRVNTKRGLKGQREIAVDCARSQLDSGFEDPERASPGGFSSKENSLKRITPKPSGDSFNEYSNVLRQASLRVFGLVGRRVKAFDEAVGKTSVDEIDKNGSVRSKEGNATQNNDTRCKNAFVSRLEEIYKAKLPSDTDGSARDSAKPVKQNDENAEEEEEEWPDPPSFDDDVNVEDGIEIMNEPSETQSRIQKSILEEGRVVHQGSVREKVSIDTGGLKEDEQRVTIVRQNRHDYGHVDCVESNPRNNRFAIEKARMQHKMDFKALGEGKGNISDISMCLSGTDSYVRDQRNIDLGPVTDFKQQRVSESEMEPVSIEDIRERGRAEDECTVCEVLSNEKRVLRRSADMEGFRKTTLSDCDSVMKKMRHAQEISRKISGHESPRRASMRKSKAGESVSSCAEGPVTQVKYVTGERSGKFHGEYIGNKVSADGGPANYKKSGLQAGVADIVDCRNKLSNDADIYKNLNGKRDGYITTNDVTENADVHALSRQHCMEQLDAKGFFLQQFEREKNRQKVKRHLSEDFLIVDAMPCLQHKEPRRYDKARHRVNSSQTILPHYHLIPNVEPRCDAAFDKPRFSSGPLDKNQEHWYGSFPVTGRVAHDSSKSYLRDQASGLPASPIDNTRPEPLSPTETAQMEAFVCRQSPHSTPYFQGNSNGHANSDPFRAKRENSWLKKAARRLRRSLSFEDNSRKSIEKRNVSEQLPIRPCNSSGNLKDEYESYVTREARGCLFSDDGLRKGVSQAAYRPTRSPSKGRQQHYNEDPNFHPKYGFIAKDLVCQQKPYSEPSSVHPTCIDAKRSSPCDASKFVVQHNMYFGNNPSTPNVRMLERNGTNLGRDFYGGNVVVQPLPVRKSSQKTAKTKLLHVKK